MSRRCLAFTCLLFATACTNRARPGAYEGGTAAANEGLRPYGPLGLPPLVAARASHSRPAPPRLAEPLPQLARPLVPVRLLRTRSGFVHAPAEGALRPEWLGLPPAEIISIHGRSPKDIWFLTADQFVLHDDGERIVKSYERPCGWGEGAQSQYGMGTKLVQILVDKTHVRVLGEGRDAYSRVGSDLTATLEKNGTWSCKENGIAPNLAITSGDYSWKLAHNMVTDECRLRALDGPCAPPPAWAPSYFEPSKDSIDMGIYSVALFMHGLDDGWIVTFDEEGRSWLHRYNGVAWLPVATLEKGLRVLDLWADEDHHAWLTVRQGGEWNDPATLVYRFDGHALEPLPVPASFKTRFVRGTGSRDVWFAGAGGFVYQWDGEVLRQGHVAFVPSDAWSSPGGEVWLVGKDGIAHTAPRTEAR